MDRKEAQTKLEGVNDFIRTFAISMQNMCLMTGTQMKKEEFDRLVEMLNGVKELLKKRYQQEISFEEEYR
jgi:hypothetical protein